MNLSVDDSNSLFEDLTNHKDQYKSIFDNSILNFMKALHDKYQIKVSFYVYYSWDCSADGFSLSQTTDNFSKEFSQNSDWLRFGFHAKDANAYECLTSNEEIKYYEKTVNELVRITGTKKCIDNFVRLDRFYADHKTVLELSKLTNGVVGLLCADNKNRKSYDLSDKQIQKVYAADWLKLNNGMVYTPTDIRVENIVDNNDFYKKLNNVSNQKIITVFTHEWKMNEENVQKYIKWFAMYANQSKRKFVFLEDLVEE